MKFHITIARSNYNSVAPYAGAWIEIKNLSRGFGFVAVVAPYAGAWIEIPHPPDEQVS